VAEPLLSAAGLSKRFGSHTAAEDISFALEGGVIHAIVGAAKSGKSTIAGLVAGTILPDKGTITFRGSAIENKSAGERVRMGIAVVAGSAAIFPEETVLDNVRITREAVRGEASSIFNRDGEATEVAAWRTLTATNLRTRSHLRAVSLGFIDRRWLEIAMALVCEPEVLVFDEPFAGAGAGEIRELCDFFHGLKRKHAILLTDRSAERVAPLAGRISVLARGRTITMGSPEEIAGRAAAGGGLGNA
jgi:branched-chain amino acid transport system ATP-binding protein